MSYLLSGFLGTVSGSIAFGVGTRLAEVLEGKPQNKRKPNQIITARIAKIFQQTGKSLTIYGTTISGFAMGAALTSNNSELANARWISLLGIACGAISIIAGKTLNATAHILHTSPRTS